MNITRVTNPIYSKADHSAIDCVVTFDTGEAHPYTAVANDSTEYGTRLWGDLTTGRYGPIAAYPGDPRPRVLEALAAYRYDAQSGGVTVDGNRYDTDPESRSALIAAYVLANLNPAFTCNWKTADDTFVTLDAAGVIAVGNAVLAFVQKCFDAEKTLTADVARYTSVSAVTSAFDAAMAA
jgi:hypothetical protein